MKKRNLPEKICPVCKLPFKWRKNGEKTGRALYIAQIDVTQINLK